MLNADVSTLTDASICVNGTLNANAGFLYTTAAPVTKILDGTVYSTGEGGASIVSTGTGVINITAPSATETYQAIQRLGNDYKICDYYAIPIASAQLKNADGTYTQTTGSANTTYVYKNGAWASAYTVTFDANGGFIENVYSQKEASVLAGETVVAPTDPLRTNFEFDGWYTAKDGGDKIDFSTWIPTATTILYAHWIGNQGNVTFVPGEGATCDPTSISVAYGAPYGELPTPSREGYTFDGWYTDALEGTKVESTTIYDGSTQLYARWTVGSYTITWNVDGQKEIDSYEYGESITPKTPTKTGYDFVRWEPEVPSVMPAGNLEFTATWKIKSVQVNLDANCDGNAVPEPGFITVNFDDVYNLSEVTFITMSGEEPKPGYEFGGWYTDPVNGTKVVSGETTVSNENAHTLYAHWTQRVCA